MVKGGKHVTDSIHQSLLYHGRATSVKMIMISQVFSFPKHIGEGYSNVSILVYSPEDVKYVLTDAFCHS